MGFRTVEPKPTASELKAFYRDGYFQAGAYSAEYTREELDHKLLPFQEASAIVDARSVGGPTRRMLDVGCGEGFSLKHFSDLGWRVSGLDFTSEGVERRNPDLRDEVQFGDLYELLDQRIDARIGRISGVRGPIRFRSDNSRGISGDSDPVGGV